jgi:hypothetical protein
VRWMNVRREIASLVSFGFVISRLASGDRRSMGEGRAASYQGRNAD